MPRQCPKCNKPFTGRKTGAVYCSPVCKRRAEGDRYYERNKAAIKIRRILRHEVQPLQPASQHQAGQPIPMQPACFEGIQT